jgi:DNA topoisomerase-1
MRYLVILESPAKRKKISKYLNSISENTFIVEASFGHICEFKDGLKSIDVDNKYKPIFKISSSKIKVVSKLRDLVKKVDQVIIATDMDREGEAIGYHLIKMLNLSVSNTKRMTFNEITEKSIKKSFNNLTVLNMNMVNSQLARSTIDLLIGYNISPLLWNIGKGLSAGRCQSPALRLVCERENLINNFKSKSNYVIKAMFNSNKDYDSLIIGEYITKVPYTNTNSIKKLFTNIYDLDYEMKFILEKKYEINPPYPYITSTIQQDASLILKLSPKITMSYLQKLYEGGFITYMRTDNTNISKDCMLQCKDYINKNFSMSYVDRQYKSKSHNSQEAHECIRPVNINVLADDIKNLHHKKLYLLIWKRTISCFLPSYIYTNYEYQYQHIPHIFQFNLRKNVQLGFKKIYNENKDDSFFINHINLPYISKPLEVYADETKSKEKPRYNEANLIRELEKRGIGRPSTFSNIINTIINRGYVKKSNIEKSYENIHRITIQKDGNIKEEQIKKNKSKQIGKLVPSDLGIHVNNFLVSNFEKINSYEYTNEINKNLDIIANGQLDYSSLVDKVYKLLIKKIITIKNDKVTMSSLKKKDNKYPIFIGEYKEEKIYIKKGPYGLYTTIKGKNMSISKENLTLDEILELYNKKKNNILKEWGKIKILNGPYGPYINKGKINKSIPKQIDINTLTEDICKDILSKKINIYSLK